MWSEMRRGSFLFKSLKPNSFHQTIHVPFPSKMIWVSGKFLSSDWKLQAPPLPLCPSLFPSKMILMSGKFQSSKNYKLPPLPLCPPDLSSQRKNAASALSLQTYFNLHHRHYLAAQKSKFACLPTYMDLLREYTIARSAIPFAKNILFLMVEKSCEIILPI